MYKLFIKSLFMLMVFLKSPSFSEIIDKINIIGNERIPNETILMFSNISEGQTFNQDISNSILKNLYDSNFFEDISVLFNKNLLTIKVKELPLIQNINIEGIKASKFEDAIRDEFILKSRSSYNKFSLSKDQKSIKNTLKNFGYYFSEVETYIETLDNNMVNINYQINLGNKAKIKNISFVGKKIYKNKLLLDVIVSEEFRFWKFISEKKYLNENLIQLDKRLLKSFYLNKGYYNVKINSSFAKMISNDEFELIYNINPGPKFFFGELKIKFPSDYDLNYYDEVISFLNEVQDKPYSISTVEEILEKIEKITLNDQFKSIKATLDEKIIKNKINIDFNISETEKFIVERINIFGNKITRENVIRNQFEIDEGDIYNEILTKKSENNLKSLNFFKEVKTEVVDGNLDKSKVINVSVEEKPTGELSAGAGLGSSGGTVMFGIKENNYLGKGLEVDANSTISSDSFKGIIKVNNPNYKNTDKSISASLLAQEIDRLKSGGYKTNKTGFEIGTKFEYLEDFYLGLSTSSFYEDIEAGSNASTLQKKQAGGYWDTFVNLDFNQDKRNQKFKTSDGYISNYNISVPIISDTNTMTNTYIYKLFGELYENNVSSITLFLQSANSLTNDDVKLSERLTIPSKRLRGFERGKVGPKDGKDFIGGNYVTSLNINSTLPYFFPNLQTLDVSMFFDAANIWGVDYDDSLSDGSKIRSSIGIGVDWFTPVGPLNFSLTETLTKTDTDIEESFRFNIGTTF